MLDKNKHEIIMKNILKDIYSDRLSASILGFKGGTACYLFYELSRFSVDLDFDLLDLEKSDDIFEKVKNILSKYGELTEARKKRNTLFYLLKYKANKQKIKVEVSTREKNNKYEIKSLLGISILTMVKSDMFANKLVAATERNKTANRDFYDISFFLKNNWNINELIIKERTGRSLKEHFEYLIKYIEKNITQANILDGLGEILTDAQKDSTKAMLKKDLLFNLQNYLSVL